MLITAIYVIVVVGQAVYLSELFPTQIRIRGTGICSAIARSVGAAIPFSIPAIFAFGGIQMVVANVGLMLGFAAIVIGVWGVETRKKSLERITG